MKQKNRVLWKRRLSLLLLIVLLFGGCSSKPRAKDTVSVVSLRYGIGHHNAFRKTIVGVDESLQLIYHVYSADTEDSKIQYHGLQRVGSAIPEVEVTAEISQEQWDTLLASDSLKNLWTKSTPTAQQTEEKCGTSVLQVTVSTSADQKIVGGYVIDDRWLYEVGEILDALAQSSGAQAESDDVLYSSSKEETTEEPAEADTLK